MGALTSNKKRGADPFSLNFRNPASFSIFPESHRPAKKLRLLQSFDEVSDPPRRSSIRKRDLKFSRYPPVKNELKRVPHAPVRPQRGRNSVNSMAGSEFKGADNLAPLGNWMWQKYKDAKQAALGSFRYLRREVKAVEKDVVMLEEDERASEGRAAGKQVVLLDEDEIASEVQPAVKDDDDDVMVLDSPPHSTPPAPIRLSTGSLGVDDAEKLLEDLQLSEEYSVGDPRVYEKLLYASKQRDPKLNKLKYEIEVMSKEWGRHQLLRPQKKEDKKDAEAFKLLSEEEEAEVSRAFSNACRRKLLVNHVDSNIGITGEVLQCLRPGAWLNDEVINLYMELLKEREKREPQKFLKCHFFSTFFYKKLVSGKGGYNYQSVRRWTTQRKLGYSLSDCDKIFVPIHKEVHWCLAVINLKDKKFQYLDSLSSGGGYYDNQVIKAMSRYFMDEVKDKNGKVIDVSDWQKELVEDLPQQRNGFDCGVFMIKYADFYSRDIGLCFTQEHMPYFRRRTAKEILKLKAD